jgi:hypothetical protein
MSAAIAAAATIIATPIHDCSRTMPAKNANNSQ